MNDIKLPKKDDKKMIGVEVDLELWTEIQKQAKHLKIPYRSVVEYGLRVWLEKTNNRKKSG